MPAAVMNVAALLLAPTASALILTPAVTPRATGLCMNEPALREQVLAKVSEVGRLLRPESTTRSGPVTAAITEAEAKAAWLAKKEAAKGGFGGAAPSYAAPAVPAYTAPVAAAPVGRMSEAEAKAAWLAKKEAAKGGFGGAAPAYAAPAAPAYTAPVAAAPVAAAPAGRMSEAEAKAAWLAKKEASKYSGRVVATQPALR